MNANGGHAEGEESRGERGERRTKRVRAVIVGSFVLVLIAAVFVSRMDRASRSLSFYLIGVTNGPAGRVASLRVSNQCRVPIQLWGYAYIESVGAARLTVPVTAYYVDTNRGEILQLEAPTNRTWRVALPVVWIDWRYRLQERIRQSSFLPRSISRRVHITRSRPLYSPWFEPAHPEHSAVESQPVGRVSRQGSLGGSLALLLVSVWTAQERS